MPTNLWQPGVSGNPDGRLCGSRNRLSEAVICALLRDFSMHGEKAIAKVRRTQPGIYLKVIAMVLPREHHKVEHRNPVKDMTDEQLERSIEILKEHCDGAAARAPQSRAPQSGEGHDGRATGAPMSAWRWVLAPTWPWRVRVLLWSRVTSPASRVRAP